MGKFVNTSENRSREREHVRDRWGGREGDEERDGKRDREINRAKKEGGRKSERAGVGEETRKSEKPTSVKISQQTSN